MQQGSTSSEYHHTFETTNLDDLFSDGYIETATLPSSRNPIVTTLEPVEGDNHCFILVFHNQRADRPFAVVTKRPEGTDVTPQAVEDHIRGAISYPNRLTSPELTIIIRCIATGGYVVLDKELKAAFIHQVTTNAREQLYDDARTYLLELANYIEDIPTLA